ncbi:MULTISPECIES: nodulation protein NopA [Bradyrhizobium]|uniref:nodulation protein NopA n=1 Tax=Bradyrhizobium TaxID=374 RepID=UPI001AD75D46|nr:MULTISPECIES: nodulation protein NopA [Bradyrhizobium]MBO4227539.1 nodulation protein NopA [Bradyrhizobium neotropicale]MCA1455137.1 nodulation protein NopA [Bradyrhizobium sp. BRP22]
MASKVGASGTSTVGGAAGTATAAAASTGAEVAGEAAFQKQIAALTATSTKAAERDVEIRVVSTELSTIKKAADERVQ